MTVTGVGESPVQRSYRQQLVWQAWLDKVKADPSLAAEGGSRSAQGDGAIDISAVVKALTRGTGVHPTASGDPHPAGQGVVGAPTRTRWAIWCPASCRSRSASYPGQRPRVRILDGTQNRDLILKATSPIVSAGGQITIIGNADRFGVPTTKIEYHDPIATGGGGEDRRSAR